MCYENNADISGVGVRVSFYLQTFFLVLLVDRSWQDAPSALWTFISTSFGLTIAAVIQASYEQLSLFQALQVANLVWLANFGTFLALASYSRRKATDTKRPKGGGKSQKADNFVKLAATTQTLFSMVLTLYVWKSSAAFGYEPSCTPGMKYIVFVFNIPAVGKGRQGVLAVTSILTAAYILITLRELWSYRSSRRLSIKRREEKKKGLPLPATTPRQRNNSSPTSLADMPAIVVTHCASSDAASDHAQATAPGGQLGITNSSQTTISSSIRPVARSSSNRSGAASSVSTGGGEKIKYDKDNQHRRRPKRRRWFADFDPMLLGIATFQAVLFTYFIVSGELLLQRNTSLAGDSIGKWGFGQILALIVVLPSTFSVIKAFQKHSFRRLHRRRRRRKENPSNHTQVPSVP